MQLFYSGAESANGIQPDPNKSLGKYVSAVPIPNGSLNNIFSPISRNMVKGDISDTRLIVVINDSLAKMNFQIWTVAGDLANYEIAAVAPARDSKGNPIFESLYNGNSLPYQATLASHEGMENAISLEVIEANDVIGIWIKRNLELDNFSPLDGNSDIFLPCSELQALLEDAASTANEAAQLIFAWD